MLLLLLLLGSCSPSSCPSTHSSSDPNPSPHLWLGVAFALALTVAAVVGIGAVVAWLGPAIGPSAFEVGGDVLAAFYLAEDDLAVHSIPETDNKYRLDLNILAGRQLLEVGLDLSHISGGDTCTYSDPQRFYSYRRDGETGRMVTLILKK